jgi:hypothetical protein
MRAINKGTGPPQPPRLSPAMQARLEAVWRGGAGFTVRCAPHRRTVVSRDPHGRTWFAKLRHGRRRDAENEWYWLHRLRELGVGVPAPVAFCARGRSSIVCTEAVAGRSMDAWFAEAAGAGELTRATAYVCAAVAPVVRMLHEAGIAYRDLYWNHVFTVDLDPARSPSFLDVERVFRPRIGWRRWCIKDLAGLLASLPIAVPRTAALRFLRECSGRLPADWKSLARAIERKAARIRAHVPKYG